MKLTIGFPGQLRTFFSPFDRAFIQFGKNPRCRAICLSKLQLVRSI